MGALRRELGRRIRQIRKAKSLTLEAAAHQAGMDSKYWGRAERGEKNLTLDSLERMLHGLGAEPLELFTVGLGRPLPAEKAEHELLKDRFRRMNKEVRRLVLALAKHLAE